VTIWTLEL